MNIRGDGGAVYTNGSQGTSMAHRLTISGNVTIASAGVTGDVYAGDVHFSALAQR